LLQRNRRQIVTTDCQPRCHHPIVSTSLSHYHLVVVPSRIIIADLVISLIASSFSLSLLCCWQQGWQRMTHYYQSGIEAKAVAALSHSAMGIALCNTVCCTSYPCLPYQFNDRNKFTGQLPYVSKTIFILPILDRPSCCYRNHWKV